MAAALVEIGALAAMAWWPGATLPWTAFGLFTVAVAAYGAGAWSVNRGAGSLVGVWAAGLLARVVLLPAEPALSDDFWRYLWDGYVQLRGINPYLYAPAAPTLEAFQTSWHALINNPTVPTIYPPVAQAVFLLAAWTGTGILGLKVVWTLADILTGVLLVRAAGIRGRRRKLTLVLYLWSPLLLVESAWNGHLEALGLVGLAGILAYRGHPLRSGLAAAWATLVKVAPLAAIPALASRLGTRFVLAFAAATALLAAPYVGAGTRMFSGLGTYAEHWRFNEGLFAVIAWLVPGPIAPRVVAGLLVLAVAVWATYRRFSASRALLAILGVGLLLSPTLHPWYALWVLPMAALTRQASWLALTCTSFVGYWGLSTYQDTGVWPQPLWGRLILWGPTLLLLVLESGARLGKALQDSRQTKSDVA